MRILALASLLFSFPAFADDTPLALGSKAPLADTKLKNSVDGKPLNIGGVAGKKGTLVVFTCNHCPFAKAWEERLVDLGNTYAKKEIGVIFINSNDPAANKGDGIEGTAERVKARGMSFPYAMDETSSVARAFGATKTPEAYVFDKDGKLSYHGTIDDNYDDAAKVQKRYLKDALEAVANGKVPTTQETKGLGCSIKLRKAA